MVPCRLPRQLLAPSPSIPAGDCSSLQVSVARAEFVVAPLVLGGVGMGWKLRPSSASPVGDAAVCDTPRLAIGLPLAQEHGVERVRYRQAKRKPASGRRLLGRRLLPPHLEQGRDHSSPMAGDSSAAVRVSRVPQPGVAPPAVPGTGLPWAPPTLVSGSPQPRPEACPVLEGVAGGQRESLGKDRQGDSREAQQKPLGWPRKCSSH